jgi:hypothetical protein
VGWLVLDDLQDHDEAEGGSEPAQGRVLVGVDLGHGPNRLAWLVAAGPKVQVDPAALELELVDLALAVLFAAGLEGQHLQVAGEALELGQQVSYRHPLNVARQALYVVLSWAPNGSISPTGKRTARVGTPGQVIDELMGHDNTHRARQDRVSRIGMGYRDTTPEMLMRAVAAIESRLAVVLEVAAQETKSLPGSGEP